MRHKLGTVRYLNARPLTDAIDRDQYEVISEVPSAVADALMRGWVDVALAPVVTALASPELRIVPGWCIGAEGPVHSVLLVAETPPEQWTRVLLDGESRTSQVLARILLEDGPLASNGIQIASVDPGTALDQAGGTVAALVIGDAARDVPDHLTQRIDLAALWTEWTGLPFVFAVWVGREALPSEVRVHLHRAGKRGIERIHQDHSGDDATYLSEHIRWPLDDAALMGLRRFAALAHAKGLVGSHEVRLFGPPTVEVSRPDVSRALSRVARGEAVSAADVVALRKHADLASLAAAAHQRRVRDHGRAVWTGVIGAVRVELDADADWVEPLAAVALTGAPEAVLLSVPGGTAQEYLRAVAVARIVLPRHTHIVVDEAISLDLAQAAWRAGATGCSTWNPSVERNIADAGLRPRSAVSVTSPNHVAPSP